MKRLKISTLNLKMPIKMISGTSLSLKKVPKKIKSPLSLLKFLKSHKHRLNTFNYLQNGPLMSIITLLYLPVKH